MGEYDHQKDEEKGYKPVPVTQPYRASLGPAEEHDLLFRGERLLSGRLTAVLICVTPLHVSSGKPKDNPNSPSPFFRRGDRLVVPGSSLKGTFRSLFEAITRSCLTLPPNDKKRRSVPEAYIGCSVEDDRGFCPACRVFGGLGYQGRVFFSDAVVLGSPQPYLETINQRWSPRRFHLGRRIYLHRDPVGLNPTKEEQIEVLPEKTQLRMEMSFSHLTQEELGLLLIALGQDRDPPKRMVVKLGGAKAAGYGAVRVVVSEMTLFSAASQRYGSFKPVPLLTFTWSKENPYPTEDFGYLIAEAKKSISYNKAGHDEIAEALKY